MESSSEGDEEAPENPGNSVHPYLLPARQVPHGTGTSGPVPPPTKRVMVLTGHALRRMYGAGCADPSCPEPRYTAPSRSRRQNERGVQGSRSRENTPGQDSCRGNWQTDSKSHPETQGNQNERLEENQHRRAPAPREAARRRWRSGGRAGGRAEKQPEQGPDRPAATRTALFWQRCKGRPVEKACGTGTTGHHDGNNGTSTHTAATHKTNRKRVADRNLTVNSSTSGRKCGRDPPALAHARISQESLDSTSQHHAARDTATRGRERVRLIKWARPV